MVLSSLREPPQGSPVFLLPYIRQLKTRTVTRTVYNGGLAAAVAPVFDKKTRKWVTPAPSDSGAGVEHVEETICPTGDAGLQICDIVNGINWEPFHGRGMELLHGTPGEPNFLKFAAFSVLRVVKEGAPLFHARVANALRYFRIFKRRRLQLVNGLRRLLSTLGEHDGLLVRAVFDASFLAVLVDDPLYSLARKLLSRKRRLPQDVRGPEARDRLLHRVDVSAVGISNVRSKFGCGDTYRLCSESLSF